MTGAKIAMLVHGGPESIEAIRARGLARNQPEESVFYFWRETNRRESTARNWQRELNRIKPDVIYVINTALPGSWLAPLLRLQRGLPFILDTGDVIYEMARSAGMVPAWKMPLLKLAEIFAQRRASCIVVRGSRHRDWLLRNGYSHVHVIHDGYLPHPQIEANAVRELKQSLGIGDAFVVGVMGSLAYSPKLDICYGWDLIQALAQLRDLPVKGMIIGAGNGHTWLEAKAKEYGVQDQLVFCGRIPYAEVPRYLRVMDVALSTQTNNLAGQVRTTGKLPEYMAAERFILASRVGEAELLLPEIMLVDYQGEVDREYPQRLAARIRYLFNNRGAMTARHSLKEIAERECSYPVLSRQFDEVIAASPAQ